MTEQCRATHADTEYQCEAKAGHDGPHYFTSYVEWEGCWSCRDGEDYPHEQGYCEAVLEALPGWVAGTCYEDTTADALEDRLAEQERQRRQFDEFLSRTRSEATS